MAIELRKFLEMSNKKSARARAKRELENKLREIEAKKPIVIAEIAKFGSYSCEEKELIFNINEMVMSVDGTAEQWGGYDFDPLDYIGTSIEIFNLTKSFYSA